MAFQERWRPSSVIGTAVIALLGLALVALAVITVPNELWGEPLFDTVGIARPRPVWMAWIAIVVAFVGGIVLFTTCAGYLYRVARGRVPRVHVEKRTRR